MKVCKQCPQLSVIKLCKVCGCIMPAKVRIRTAGCPEGKWLPIEDDGQLHFVDDQVWEQQEQEIKKTNQAI